MTLLKRAETVSNNVRSLKDLEKRAEQAQLFEKRANDLERPAVLLRQLEPSIAILVEQHIIAAAVESGTVAAIKSRVKDLHSRYLLDKNVMIDPFPKEDIRFVLYRALEQLTDGSDAALLEAWGEWGRRQLPCVDNEVLALLEKIDVLRVPAQAVRMLRQEAEEIFSSLPADKGAITRLKDLADDMSETWHNLAGEGVPIPVMAFLKKAITYEGARFEDLTVEVRNWISEHGLSNSLRVRVG